MAEVTVSKYWAENLFRMQEMLAGGVVYVDFVMRGTSQRYDIMLSNIPFKNDTPEAYKEWSETAICAYRVKFEDQKRANIWSMWESHSLASILTVAGYEVMMGNVVRRTGKGSQSSFVKPGTTDMLAQSFSSFQRVSKEKPETEQPPEYLEYSGALDRLAASYNLYGELPREGETINTVGDVPAERFVRSTTNSALMEEGM